MRHKPGSRCTVRYDLDLDPATSDGAPTMVVAKTYRGDKGPTPSPGCRRCGTPPSRPGRWSPWPSRSPTARPPPPGAGSRRRGAHAQGPRALHLRRPEDERATALGAVGAELAKAADGLAALHDSGIEHGEVVTWEEELGDVRNLIARSAGRCPARRARSRRSSTGSKSAAAGPAEAVAPCHRSFRPAQVLLHHGRIAFIDFDGLAMAEPALDVALFRAAVRDVGAGALLGFGAPQPEVDQALGLGALCDGFLARCSFPTARCRPSGWCCGRPWISSPTSCCWTKIKPERLVTRMTLLDRHIATAGLG